MPLTFKKAIMVELSPEDINSIFLTQLDNLVPRSEYLSDEQLRLARAVRELKEAMKAEAATR